MANVGKRTRSGRAKLEPKWCESLTPDQARQQHGRSICFRVAQTPREFEFYCIPFDFGNKQPKNPDVGEELPTGILPFQINGNIPWLSTFAVAGSSLFCFGGKEMLASSSRRSLSSAIYRYDDTTGDIRGRWYTHSGFNMIVARYGPQIIAMQCGKLLVMGGGMKKIPKDGQWAEVFDPYLNFCSPESCLPIELQCSPLVVTAALRSSNQILVASTESNAAFVCDVTTLVWDKFVQSDEFVFGKAGSSNSMPFSYLKGEAAVVRGTILCWFNFRGNLLRAYDMKLKMWFEKPIIGLKKVGKLRPDIYDNDFSLLPLDYDHICLLWFDHSPYAPETSYRVLHCIKVLVSIEDARKPPIFKASVISFRSYVLKQQFGNIQAVVL
ncbi:hypothetical protein Vadar_027705 [Vaccinium darrowii]|uniref:Uncharacterized protein n=1 Tax=Vaccinium darrowii TaxID=229202 RepID=A0ACB7YQQ2_9ERIC|nr:hypothetical protein Vadar_027705 [Vaccinium darrowii]